MAATLDDVVSALYAVRDAVCAQTQVLAGLVAGDAGTSPELRETALRALEYSRDTMAQSMTAAIEAARSEQPITPAPVDVATADRV